MTGTEFYAHSAKKPTVKEKIATLVQFKIFVVALNFWNTLFQLVICYYF